MDALKKNLRQEHVLIHDFLSTFYTQVCSLNLAALLEDPFVVRQRDCLTCPQKLSWQEHIMAACYVALLSRGISN